MSNETFKTLVYKRVQFGIQHVVGRGVPLSIVVDSVADHLTHDLIVQLRLNVAGKDHVGEVERKSVDVPLTWWDHFKQRWFTKRMLQRWPIKSRRIGIEIYRTETRVCPHFDVDWGERRDLHFHFLENTRPRLGMIDHESEAG